MVDWLYPPESSPPKPPKAIISAPITGLGAEVGGHLDINLTVHHQVRFNFSIQAFVDGTKDRETSYSGSGSWSDWDDDWDDWFHRSSTNNKNAVSNSFGIIQAGCDYVYNVQSPSKGPYLLAGIHVNSLSKATTLPSSQKFTFSQSRRMGYRVGVGYNVNRFISLECQYNTLPVESGGAEGFGFDTLSWVSATAVFRFGRP